MLKVETSYIVEKRRNCEMAKLPKLAETAETAETLWNGETFRHSFGIASA
jgi:hypothetical protein